MPHVRPVQPPIPAWRWGVYWGAGEGIEWTLGRRNPLSLMLRTERVLFDCNNWALRISLIFCSLYVEIHMPWHVENRKFFFAWYPTLRVANCYIQWKYRHIQFF